MDELGYVPNSNAKRLISGRSSLVGLWDTADEEGPFTHIGHDDLPLLAPARQSLTTVHIDVAEIRRLVAETMFELLDSPLASIPTRRSRGRLVERQTTGPAPADR